MWLVHVVLCLVLLAGLMGCAAGAPAGYAENEIYVCGGKEIFVIDAQAAREDPEARVWSWTPADSPEIPAAHRSWFRAMDECKPVLGGSAVLGCSSSGGGVVLVRRSDKKCLFYAAGRNAHSAELIGEKLLVGAFSFKSDELRLYRLGSNALAAKSVWTMPLYGAHGVVWDRARKVLWALGEGELLKLSVNTGAKPSAEVLAKWKLPSPGGHDLFPLDETHLAVTVGRGVYRFNVEAETFSPLPKLAEQANVKSVSRHPGTGQVLYTQSGPQGWWTRKVRFVGGEPIVLGPLKLYKARWNAPNAFSYAR